MKRKPTHFAFKYFILMVAICIATILWSINKKDKHHPTNNVATCYNIQYKYLEVGSILLLYYKRLGSTCAFNAVLLLNFSFCIVGLIRQLMCGLNGFILYPYWFITLTVLVSMLLRICVETLSCHNIFDLWDPLLNRLARCTCIFLPSFGPRCHRGCHIHCRQWTPATILRPMPFHLSLLLLVLLQSCCPHRMR